MKKLNKAISIILICLIMIMLFSFNKVNAASASLSASSTSVTVGTTVTLTATITAGAWNVSITGNGVNQPSVGQTDTIGNKTVTLSTSFTPQSAGSYTFYLTGDMTDFSEDQASTVSQSITINVTDPTPEPTPEPEPEPTPEPDPEPETPTPDPEPETPTREPDPEPTYPQETNPNQTTESEVKSSNNYLSGITLGTGTLSPEFYRETYEYTVEFDDTVDLHDLTEIEINATTENDKATVSGTGTIQLQEGENNITLTVTAENGSARDYVIKINKPAAIEQSTLRLKTLVVNGITTEGTYQTIQIDFDPETFEYDLTVPNNISSISVNPTTENEDIVIETTGGETLNEGNNRIIIILTNPDDETMKTTYTLNIERQAAIVENTQDNSKEQMGIIIIGSVIGIVVLVIVIVAIVKHRKRMNRYDYDYDDEDDDNVNYLNNEDEIDDPYPNKIITRTDDDEKENNTNDVKHEYNNNDSIYQESPEEDKKLDNDEDIKLKTTYNEENTEIKDNEDKKSKWDEFVKGYDDSEDDDYTKKKRKHEKIFLD